MGTLIVVIIVGLLIWGGISGFRMAKTQDTLKEAFIATHEGWDVYTSPFNGQEPIVLAIGRTDRRLAVGNLAHPHEVSWSEISEVEIERNGASLVQTNRGSQAMGAAVGAVLLGPMGLLLGGLTGSQRSVQRVNDLTLRVVIDNQSEPVHRVQFFKHGGKGVKPDSSILKEPVHQIEKFQALIANAIRTERNERTDRSHSLPGTANVEDRISQLWQLKQSGALSDKEFNTAKASLLTDGTALRPPLPTSDEALAYVDEGDVARETRAYGSGTYPLTEAELSVYGSEQLRVLKTVLDNGIPQNERKVAETICRKIGWEIGAGDERAFLESFYVALREWQTEAK